MQLAGGEVQEPAMKQITAQMKLFDDKREDLDVDIYKMLEEVSTAESNNPEAEAARKKKEKEERVRGNDYSSDEEEQKTSFQQLCDKIIDRQREMEAQQKAVKEAYTKHHVEVKQELTAIEGVADLGKEMFEEFGDPIKQQGH